MARKKSKQLVARAKSLEVLLDETIMDSINNALKSKAEQEKANLVISRLNVQ